MTTTRKFCEPLFFNKKQLEKATKINLIEKVCLFFIKKTIHIDRIENITTISKTFRKKLYILEQFYNLPTGYNCRHVFIKSPSAL
jgi:glycine cleavage system regulatory protein